MTSNWIETTIGDFLTLQRGHDLTEADRRRGKVPVLGAAGHNGFHDTAKARGPGIVVGRSGGSFGKVHLCAEDFWPHNTAMYVRDYKGNDRIFSYYLLKNLNFDRLNSGSAQPSLNRNYVHPVRIRVPKLSQQQRIAKVLSAFDAKIELNNRINKELEGLAKLLYDYWFVQFDFPISGEQAAAMSRPDLEGKPYGQSGGKMVYNKTLKREIPEGWEASTIGQTFVTYLGGTPSRKVPNYWNLPQINWLCSGENPSTFVVEPDEMISQEGLENSPCKLLPKGTVILSIVRHLRASILSIEAATNQSVVGILETEWIKRSFIYPYIVREIPRLMALRTGAQQPHINKGVLDESPLVIPDENTLAAYTDVAEPIFSQIENCLLQNQHLTELRDWLLPMLMNGQATVQPESESPTETKESCDASVSLTQ